jgi:hypothetical protein
MSQKSRRSGSSGATLDLSVGKALSIGAKCSDADGWIVVWDMAPRRPVAVWRGHEAGVLSIRNWDTDKLLTY